MPIRRKKATHTHTHNANGYGTCPCGRPASKHRFLPGDVRSINCGGLFTIAEVLENPLECRKKCSAQFFEEEVSQPLLKDRYASNKKPRALTEDPFKCCLDETYLYSNHSDGIQVARTHRMIADIVLDSTFAGTFSYYWNLLDREERREAIYSSLDKSMRPHRGVNKRLLCPDLSAALAEGDHLLDIVKLITYSALKYPKSDNYLPVPCKEFDAHYEIDEPNCALPKNRLARSANANLRNSRNQAIGDFVLELVRSWYLLDPPQVLAGAVVQKPRRIICCDAPYARGDLVGRNAIYEEITNSSSEEHIRLGSVCRACRRFAGEIVELDEVERKGKVVGNPEGGERDKGESCSDHKRKGKEEGGESESKFLYCKNCRLIGRMVPYCSQDCQQADWKGHKVFCGRNFVDLALPFADALDLKTPIYKFDMTPQPGIGMDLIKSIPLEYWNRDIVLLMDRAVETRSEHDVQKFIREFASVFFKRIPGFEEAYIAQMSRDWELDRVKVAKWSNEGFDKSMERLSAMIGRLHFSKPAK